MQGPIHSMLLTFVLLELLGLLEVCVTLTSATMMNVMMIMMDESRLLLVISQRCMPCRTFDCESELVRRLTHFDIVIQVC